MAHGGDIEGGLAPPPEAIAAATPPVEAHAPRVLTFDDVSYTVKTGSGSKVVLAPVSGSCVGGRLFVLMGPSGAGKTSLLDILAGAPVAGKPAGHVLLNGKPMARGRSGDGQRALSCYVQQRDVLLPSATVREALTTAAMLQLPLSLPIALKRERVNQLLAQLDLLRCADTLIGDESFGIKGISGGEKRRTSVGIELVKDPAVVFLDEPTSGLDSEMALGVMRAIKALARQGKVCVATIHQPASDITDLFDDFMLLSLGRVVYQGPWLDAVPYFSKHGYA